MSQPEFITMKEFGKRCMLDNSTVSKLVAAGEVPTWPIARPIRIDWQAFVNLKSKVPTTSRSLKTESPSSRDQNLIQFKGKDLSWLK